jgi:hypothetical protein
MLTIGCAGLIARSGLPGHIANTISYSLTVSGNTKQQDGRPPSNKSSIHPFAAFVQI